MNLDYFYNDQETCTHFESDPKRFFGAMTPPTFDSSIYVYLSHEEFAVANNDKQYHFLYTRGTNPTVEIVEKN
jgi:cystathionine beta-lyase/cystathionine gamma-synthase